MRRTFVRLKDLKSYTWYEKYLKEGPEGFQKFVPPTPFNWNQTSIKRPKAYFSINIDGEDKGKLVFELAQDIVPKTVDNFIRLCEGKSHRFSGYKETIIHLVRKGEVIMGGDVEKKEGGGNYSSYERRYFEDENFIIPHTERGLISMASVGVHTNASQFYVTLNPAKHLNGRCVTFGRLVEGDDTLKAIESVFTHRSKPTRDVLITDCGVIYPE